MQQLIFTHSIPLYVIFGTVQIDFIKNIPLHSPMTILKFGCAIAM